MDSCASDPETGAPDPEIAAETEKVCDVTLAVSTLRRMESRAVNPVDDGKRRSVFLRV